MRRDATRAFRPPGIVCLWHFRGKRPDAPLNEGELYEVFKSRRGEEQKNSGKKTGQRTPIKPAATYIRILRMPPVTNDRGYLSPAASF